MQNFGLVFTNRLYQRATGFEHDSEEIKIMSSENGQYVERVPIRKIYPPDTVAAIFWLKNRQKEKWRDKTEIDHSGKIGVSLIESEPDGRDEPIAD
jgi:hypothetical protein